jgi:hypothetical protein
LERKSVSISFAWNAGHEYKKKLIWHCIFSRIFRDSINFR